MNLKSLKTKLLIMLLAVLIISNSLIGFASQMISRRVVSSSVNENLSNVASKTANEIYAVNQNQFTMLESLATQPFIKDETISLEEKNKQVGAIARRNITKIQKRKLYRQTGKQLFSRRKRNQSFSRGIF